MVRTIAFVVQGVFTAVAGCLGVIAAQQVPAGVRETALQVAVQTRLVDAIIVFTVLAVLAIVALGISDHIERKKEKADRERHNRYIAELHADRFQGGIAISQGQGVNAVGVVTNPTIAESVKNGDVFSRFSRENITLLGAAGLRLAKLYRDFANKPVDRADIDSGKYLTDFWADYPFREFSALKDRMKDVLGFEIAPATEALPSDPHLVRQLARHLEKEALKIREDVPL